MVTKKQIRANLEWVQKQILAQPKRYDQTWYCASFEDCKTVGCIAGWLDVRLNGFREHQKHDHLTVVYEARKALGLKVEAPLVDLPATWIFYNDTWLFYNDFGNKLGPIKTPGTLAAAKQACKAIDMYMKEIGV